MGKRYFISGIGTDVGKTIVAAVLAEKLRAHYWKPVQCGTDGGTDCDVVHHLCPATPIYQPTYRLKDPISPHEAARRSGCAINLSDFGCPDSGKSPLIIEGAGGLLVPMNGRDTMFDLARHLDAGIILVVRHYLGSINHSLLSMEFLRRRSVKYYGYVISGNRDTASERILNKMGHGLCIGCIEEACLVNRSFVLSQKGNIDNGLL